MTGAPAPKRRTPITMPKGLSSVWEIRAKLLHTCKNNNNNRRIDTGLLPRDIIFRFFSTWPLLISKHST